jgi:sugar lactone lactonase YvrE
LPVAVQPRFAALRISRSGLICTPVLIVLAVATQFSSAQSETPVLLRPSALAYDASGDLFITDTDRNQVLEITLAGSVRTVAGDGLQGYGGDGGPAPAAELNSPQGIAVAANGALYIADTGNQRIRIVQNGQINTFAGGSEGFSGDGGPASAAKFNQPSGIALDGSGALLICDRANRRVRRVINGTITTIAGNGIQGFLGDGGPAVAAELNEPSDVAVDSSGRVFIADTANQRIRVITTDGEIATFAGNGAAGFAGDGHPAVEAQLDRPRGVAIDASGDVLIADENNQRLRRVGADGMITTIAGKGVQGLSSDGTLATAAPLNLPGAVAVSVFGWPVLSDAANHALRVLLDDGKLYEPAGLTARASALNATIPDAIYGTSSAQFVVSSSGGTPHGIVQVFDGSTEISQTALTLASANLLLPRLSAGSHLLTSVYQGDGVHPAATASSTVNILPAPIDVSAAGANMTYGGTPPLLTGTYTGVLPQDSGSVGVTFSAEAPQDPGAGSYPITASLSGPASGNYKVTLAPGSGSLVVAPATPVVTLSPIVTAYAGLPLQVTAQVSSTTRGVPTGMVEFLDGGVPVATAALVNGSATSIYLAPAGGSHTLAASYTGDQNFTPGTSAKVVADVLAMPDFGVSVGSSSQQTVLAGSNATYLLNVASQGTPFTGVVTFSASGLPAGSTASFSPSQVVPGAGSAAVTMTIATLPTQSQVHRVPRAVLSLLVCALLLPFTQRRRRLPQLALLCLIAVGTLGLGGCGARTASEAALPVQTYAVTVRATSTNLAGDIVVHSVNVTLGVEQAGLSSSVTDNRHLSSCNHGMVPHPIRSLAGSEGRDLYDTNAVTGKAISAWCHTLEPWYKLRTVLRERYGGAGLLFR